MGCINFPFLFVLYLTVYVYTREFYVFLWDYVNSVRVIVRPDEQWGKGLFLNQPNLTHFPLCFCHHPPPPTTVTISLQLTPFEYDIMNSSTARWSFRATGRPNVDDLENTAIYG